MADDYLTPEQKARFEKIDPRLGEAGWVVQRFKEMNLAAGAGVAVREYPTPTGPVDYALYVDRKLVGTLEAKKAGEVLTKVEVQTRRYADGLEQDAQAKGLPHWRLPLPFHYTSTGEQTMFVDLRDPIPRPRETFTFHRPDTLCDWAKEEESLRTRLQQLPPLDPSGLRTVQVEAIEGLEASLAESRPRALVKVTGGAGKTYLGAAETYRLLKFGGMKRVLFLVDRLNLGRQAYDEFVNYVTPDDGRKFGDIYTVQLLRKNKIDDAAAVVITTLQRFYRTLRGDTDTPEDLEETSLFEIEALADETPVEVSYRPDLPIEKFDLIWIDECHRSIYGKYGQVLDYFDSFKFGLSATPVGATYGYFDGNVVKDYTYEESVIDGINVDYAVYRIKTEISEGGATVDEGEVVKVRDRLTRKTSRRTLDDELTYDKKKLDRAVVAPDQIRTVIRAFRDRCLPEMFPDRSEVPKTLIFCKTDSHAEDVLKIIREEFAGDWDFAKKITYRAEGKTDDLVRDLRNDSKLRIAVTVDQLATGTDVRALECLIFLRFVNSRTYFEQMKYRGVRTIDVNDLRAVTGSATEKERFILVDCVGITDEGHAWTAAPPLERDRTVPLDSLLQQVAMGVTSDEVLTTVGARLKRLDKRLDEEQRDEIQQLLGKPLAEVARDLVVAASPDKQEDAAIAARGEPDDPIADIKPPTDEEIAAVAEQMVTAATEPLLDAKAREAILNAQRDLDQIIDVITQDTLLSATVVDRDEAEQVVETFKEFIETNRDEFIALKAFYEAPYRRRLTLPELKKLADGIKKPPYLLTPERVWDAYEKLESARVRGHGGKIAADLVSLVRFTLGEDDELVPHREVVRLRFDLWLTEQGESEKFTAQQLRWLEMVRDHVEESVTIDTEDFDLDPFAQAGGLIGAHQAFGDELAAVLAELNERLVGV